MEDIITVENLAYAYPDLDGQKGTQVFENLNLTIESGSFVAILGTNGCGKSTLAKHFNSILLPSGGKVYVDGIDTSDLNRIMAVRRCVGMVFQNPDNQIVANVVEEDVAFGPENLGVAAPEIRRRVDKALKQVGMYEYREHAPHLLSGGQKQRVAIARMLMQRAPIMVFDDSLSAVDAETDAKIRAALHESLGKATVLLISHRVTTLMQADCILVLDGGRVSELGTHAELIAKPGIYRDIYDIQMSSDDRRLLGKEGV